MDCEISGDVGYRSQTVEQIGEISGLGPFNACFHFCVMINAETIICFSPEANRAIVARNSGLVNMFIMFLY